MSDDQYGQIIRWFEKLSSTIEVRFERIEARLTRVESEVHETRELMADMQNDMRVQRAAIAHVAGRLDGVEVKVSALEAASP